MEKKGFRVRVMKYAHRLAESTGKTWPVCLMKAWELYRLAKRMRDGIVRFAYQKIDGTVRHANGTLHNLPYGKREAKPGYRTFTYYDVDKSEFRCFRIENLVTIY